MKLNMIESGHWEVAQIPYPNKAIKTKNKKRALSFFTHPEEPQNYFDGKLFEAEMLDPDAVNDKIMKGEEIDPEEIDVKSDKKLAAQKQEAQRKIINPQVKQLQADLHKVNTELLQKQKTADQNAIDAKNLNQNVGKLSSKLTNLSKII
jgi:hypothetical protein